MAKKKTTKKTTTKKYKKSRKGIGGRPIKITAEVLQKLEDGFLMGFSDPQACLYADVPMSTFYDYCKKHPKFSDRKEQLKGNVNMKAKKVVYNAINEDKDVVTARWNLEKTDSDNYSGKEKHEHSGKVGLSELFNAATGVTEDKEDK